MGSGRGERERERERNINTKSFFRLSLGMMERGELMGVMGVKGWCFWYWNRGSAMPCTQCLRTVLPRDYVCTYCTYVQYYLGTIYVHTYVPVHMDPWRVGTYYYAHPNVMRHAPRGLSSAATRGADWPRWRRSPDVPYALIGRGSTAYTTHTTVARRRRGAGQARPG